MQGDTTQKMRGKNNSHLQGGAEPPTAIITSQCEPALLTNGVGSHSHNVNDVDDLIHTYFGIPPMLQATQISNGP